MTKRNVEVTPDRENAGLNEMPYIVEIKGLRDPRITAVRTFYPETGRFLIMVKSPLKDGKPVLADSTMDTIARRINSDAKISYKGGKGKPAGAYFRSYWVN